MTNQQTNEKPNFTFVRAFNAPKELVFNAFGNAEALNAWWGPVETRNSVIKLDFRPGGIFHFKMESEERTSYGRFLFRIITPHDRLEFTNAFADEHAQLVRAPFGFPFPLEILYRLTFTETNGKTTLTLTGEPVDANSEEEAAFRSINEGMEQGFGATFDQLAIYLNKPESR